jgi:glycosyltransferase involved in cell wall biosynthesis
MPTPLHRAHPELTCPEPVASGPQISVNVPTRNSGATLDRCLDAVAAQQVDTEIVVADDCSTDGTLEIAEAHGAKILTGPLPLLEARHQAARASSAEIVVLLDADQFLRPEALLRSVRLLEQHDALALEESSENPTTWVSRLFEADRRLLHALAEHHLDSAKGTLLPRVFRRSTLLRAFDRIPARVRHVAVAQDHAILYDAASPDLSSVGLVPDAVTHQEMERLRDLWRKYYRWGSGLVELFRVCPHCRELTASNVRGRFYRGDASRSDYARSLTLLGLKAVPYSLGYLRGRLRRA